MPATQIVRNVANIPRLVAALERSRHSVLSRPIVGDLATMCDGGGKSSSITNGNYRIGLTFARGARDLAPIFGNLNGWQAPTYNSKIRVACAFEPAAVNGTPSGTIRTFLWAGGQKYLDLTPGAVAAPIPLGANLAPGATGFLRYNVQVGTAIGGSSGDSYPAHNLLYNGASGAGWGNVEDSGASGNCAVAAVSFADSVTYAYGPLCVTGTPMVAGSPTPSVAVWGDSICTGAYSWCGSGFVSAALGWPKLAFGSTGYLSLSGSGQTVTSFTDATAPGRQALLTGGWSDLVVALGTNDAAGGLSLATYKTGIQAFATYCAWAGIRLWLCTSTPRTTSSNSFATVAGQTPVTGCEPGTSSTRGQLNGWLYSTAGADLAAGLPAGCPPLSFGGVIDMAAPLEVDSTGAFARYGGYWRPSTPSSPTQSWTFDGTHPGQAGHAAMAAQVPIGLFV